MPIQYYLIIGILAILANFAAGYFFIRLPSQGALAQYLYEIERINPIVLLYKGNVGFVLFFRSRERLQVRTRAIIWPLGWVVPTWFAMIFAIFQFAVIALVWWLITGGRL